MNWVQRKIYLYNVTFGLYMLDWWERFLFNTLVVVLMWFVCYNGFRNASEFCKRVSLQVLSGELCNNDKRYGHKEPEFMATSGLVGTPNPYYG
ncbi:uncharacterized protein LOC114278407 [Camellia sinensis]|uniref:uncharacterized protein LOC114278407 n=1 Tax=Camellia sinensis TaxID=4442 RepID=UPI001035F369|nr:uncharacterized protein LOC114278407 [Camellia sinensis]XP_028076241.1 uncharacterized protein LOC114278407 [Camellia sinensis]XP_028076242.1 uncharacterized protein LOC114278407 [Camellia sinensis]